MAAVAFVEPDSPDFEAADVDSYMQNINVKKSTMNYSGPHLKPKQMTV